MASRDTSARSLASSSVALSGRSASSGPGDDILKEIDRCTTIIVGKNAGTEGPMTTHTADCSDCDFRLAKVPARDWETGTLRPLYLYKVSQLYRKIIVADDSSTSL